MGPGDDAPAGPAGAAVFHRLAGLETEYAVRFHPDPAPDGSGRPSPRPPAAELFSKLVAELRRVVPAAASALGKKGFYLANGGAVWHESPRTSPHVALVEGSTPECRGPRRLLSHQRAQDALLAAAARDTSAGGELTLCKSDRDAGGSAYGAQENYELTLAHGWRLSAWRAGLVLLVPTVVFGWLGVMSILVLLVPYYLIAAVAYLAILAVWRLLAACGVGAARRGLRDDATQAAFRAATFGRGCAGRCRRPASGSRSTWATPTFARRQSTCASARRCWCST